MKFYLIKKHCEATVTCTVAVGRIQDYYYGRPANYLSRDFLPAEEAIRSHGYDSRKDAQERLEAVQKSAKIEESCGYWSIIPEILEVEV